MTNILSFPTAKSSTWKLLEEGLQATSDPKGALNVHAEVSKIGRLLPSLACDPLPTNEHGVPVSLASTFTGAAALCSRVLVHDLPALNPLGCVTDGHVLWVPQNQLPDLLRKSEDDLVAWAQDGVTLCANIALGREQYPTYWNAIAPQQLRALLQHTPHVFEQWAPHPAQDRARYQSALRLCGVEEHAVETVWDSGEANAAWGEILRTLETTRAHQQWTNQRVAVKGAPEIGKVVAGLTHQLEGALLKRALWTALSQMCPAMDEQQLNSIFLAAADHLNSDNDVDTVMGILVEWQVECDNYRENGKMDSLGADHSETRQHMLHRLSYAQWKDHPTPSNQLMTLVTAPQHQDECSKEALKLCARVPLSSQEIVDLAHLAPQLLLEAFSTSTPPPTADLFMVVAASFVNHPWEHSNNCAPFANTLIALLEKGWAKNATDLAADTEWDGSDEQIDRGLSWMFMIEDLAGHDEDQTRNALEAHWPRLVDAALSLNPNFATQLLWLLCEHEPVPALVYETLIAKGANLQTPAPFGSRQDLLGDAVLRKTDSVSLKSLIRRQLSDAKFGTTNVVGIGRKLE